MVGLLYAAAAEGVGTCHLQSVPQTTQPRSERNERIPTNVIAPRRSQEDFKKNLQQLLYMLAWHGSPLANAGLPAATSINMQHVLSSVLLFVYRVNFWLILWRISLLSIQPTSCKLGVQYLYLAILTLQTLSFLHLFRDSSRCSVEMRYMMMGAAYLIEGCYT
jgi:hypothetical protein